jgi:hypothetical protein
MRRRAYRLLQTQLLRVTSRVEPAAARRVVGVARDDRDCRVVIGQMIRELYEVTGSARATHLRGVQLLLARMSLEDCNELRSWLLSQLAREHWSAPAPTTSHELEFVPAAAERAAVQEFESLAGRDFDFSSNDEICNISIVNVDTIRRSCVDSGLEPATEYALRFALLPTIGLPETAPDIHVVVFGYGGELSIPNGAAKGKYSLRGTRYYVSDASSPAFADREGRYLFVRFLTPTAPGVYRIRCSIYANATLLQSRVVSIGVGNEVGITMHIDYRLARTISPQIASIETPHLSLMLNSDPLSTHTLRLFCQRPQVVGNATFDHHEISDFVEDARAALRVASWGDADTWSPSKPYLYATRDSQRLRRDLRMLALRGRRFYVEMGVRFAGSAHQLRALEPSLRQPGGIELALRDGARLLLPISVVYDLPLDTALPRHDFCDIFLSALDENIPLAETVCFRTGCRYTGHTSVICASGFWGFRHWIAVPTSLPKSGSWPHIAPAREPAIVVGMATSLVTARDHVKRLLDVSTGAAFTSITARDELLRTLRSVSPHLLYLYCHAGVDHNVPYFRVGPPSDPAITGDTLYTAELDWSQTRPLVFLNGCETAAVSADVALSLVSQFVHYAAASGVIGTEITAFESVASEFGEAFFRHFLAGVSAVKAVRLARLTMLQNGNPLGLIYVPFVPATVSLMRPQVTSSAA